MNKNLLIVFAKNIQHGKVKTRLAKSIGNDAAFEVYKHLVEITEMNTEKLNDCDVHIYFSDMIIEHKWPGKRKFVQKGNDLGERMFHAFQNSFSQGYEKVMGVGTDLPDLDIGIMQQGFVALNSNDVVFGPAEDGGYYLIGMSILHSFIFENKAWSTPGLLKSTLQELKDEERSVELLKTLNDVDTIEDLKTSTISKRFSHFFPIVA